MAGEAIGFEREGERVEGYLAAPEGAPRAGVVVIQEWWGLNDDIRSIADRFAAGGYLAFAPDLYNGQVAHEPDEARKLAMALERDLAARSVDLAIAWLKQERGVARVGCVGFCMGGGLTLEVAMRPSANADAVHVYYGGAQHALAGANLGGAGAGDGLLRRPGRGDPGRAGGGAAQRPRDP